MIIRTPWAFRRQGLLLLQVPRLSVAAGIAPDGCAEGLADTKANTDTDTDDEEAESDLGDDAVLLAHLRHAGAGAAISLTLGSLRPSLPILLPRPYRGAVCLGSGDGLHGVGVGRGGGSDHSLDIGVKRVLIAVGSWGGEVAVAVEVETLLGGRRGNGRQVGRRDTLGGGEGGLLGDGDACDSRVDSRLFDGGSHCELVGGEAGEPAKNTILGGAVLVWRCSTEGSKHPKMSVSLLKKRRLDNCQENAAGQK